jgi:hypothetical protein
MILVWLELREFFYRLQEIQKVSKNFLKLFRIILLLNKMIVKKQISKIERLLKRKIFLFIIFLDLIDSYKKSFI